MRRKAFTMIELIFVIVIIGIIAKFGVEFLIKAYDGYVFSAVQNKLQTQTEIALEQITNRLQYRIKPSVIARYDNNNFSTNYKALANANGDETILEWVGYDIDGLRGNWNGTTTNIPTWSGFVDLASATTTSLSLNSLGTNTTNTNGIISALSNGVAGIAQSAIFFIGGNSDIDGFGWDGAAINNNIRAMHPIHAGTTATDIALDSNLTGVDAYEYYQLAWSAYALVWNGQNISHNIGYVGSLDDNTTTDLFKDVLPSPLKQGTQNGQWRRISANNYAVKVDNMDVNFIYTPADGSFTCTADNTPAGKICKRLIN